MEGVEVGLGKVERKRDFTPCGRARVVSQEGLLSPPPALRWLPSYITCNDWNNSQGWGETCKPLSPDL